MSDFLTLKKNLIPRENVTDKLHQRHFINLSTWQNATEVVVRMRSGKLFVLKTFTKFTRKHLCWGLLFNEFETTLLR